VPLFVPTGGLAKEGAIASVGPTFKEMGRLAGEAAKRALEGLTQGDTVYASRVEVVINKPVAEGIGLEIPEEALAGADKVLP